MENKQHFVMKHLLISERFYLCGWTLQELPVTSVCILKDDLLFGPTKKHSVSICHFIVNKLCPAMTRYANY